jgi:mannose-6-phosphate isomerase-like protein (cupin superfamily)
MIGPSATSFHSTKDGRNAIMALSADVRRVVTTIDKNDKAVVLMDGPNPHKKVRPLAQTVSRVVWVTDQTPADLSGTGDRAAVEIGIMPPRGGSVFRIVDFPPETAEVRNADPSTMHHSLGDGVPKRGLPPRHSAMHRTRTVDYAVVMSGEIDMLLDDSEIHLKAGDVLVQQGTNHAWVNRGTEPCRIAFVLIDAKEP